MSFHLAQMCLHWQILLMSHDVENQSNPCHRDVDVCHFVTRQNCQKNSEYITALFNKCCNRFRIVTNRMASM